MTEPNLYQLVHPFTMTVAGITQSGKTQFVKKLLENTPSVISPCPQRVYIFYTEMQEAYSDLQRTLPSLTLVEGLNINLEDFDPTVNNVVVIDDQMADLVGSLAIQKLFTRGVHHRSISVIVLTQNLFPQGKFGRDIRLNCQYYVVMKSPTFASQIAYLGRQLFPTYPTFLPDAYKKATANPYSYLFINLHPLCNDDFRVGQGLLSGEANFLYVPK